MGASPSRVIHPFLFAIYPVLFIYARNMIEVSVLDALRPAAVLLVLASVIFLAARAVLKNDHNAGLLITVLLVMFFSYGHAITPLRGKVLAGYVVGRSLVFGPLWCLFTLFLALLVIRTKRNLVGLTRFANVFGIALVAMSLLQIATYRVQPARTGVQVWKDYVKQSTAGEKALRPSVESMPDIYYIILDEYLRTDCLQSYFGYDNTPFMNYLKSKGFYVAEKSSSNYRSTYLSLASSLNFDYLDALGKQAEIGSVDSILGPLIQDSRAIHLLKNAGYTFVFFPSGFHVTHRNPNADIRVTRSGIEMSEFDRVLFDSTMLQPLNGWVGSYRKKILYTFDELPNVAKTKAPTFTFAHITVPHRPYVFDAEGKATSQSLIVKDVLSTGEYRKLYTGQLTYINTKVEAMVDRILANSETPPIIILQADHGIKSKVEGAGSPGMELQSAILNAYHLPQDGTKHLYPSISPVNTFRVIFNHHFGADYDLLNDFVY